MGWEIRQYRNEDKERWDAFIASSRNATFLFMRDYMDYHSDRFEDCSLMAFRNGRLASVLPANLDGETLHSHQGLTYGGWCLPADGIDGGDFTDLWLDWLDWCEAETISKIIYKPLPSIYHLMPSQEDIYMLLKTGTPLISNLSSTIDLEHNPGFNKLQRRHLSHLPENIFYLRNDIGDKEIIHVFHKLLTECLQERHEASPVHSEAELATLMERFPANIHLWTASEESVILAGVCTFLTSTCLHCQYIATSLQGRECNILPGLIREVIKFASQKGIRYLDFGISNEDHGKILNRGLNRQKTSFGASGSAYTTWLINC